MSRDSPFRDDALAALLDECLEPGSNFLLFVYDPECGDIREQARDWLTYSADDLVDERCREFEAQHSEMWPNFASVGAI